MAEASNIHTYQCKLSREARAQLTHDPVAIQVISDLAERGAALANQLAVLPDAEYEVVLQNVPGTTRARAFVAPANPAAVVDDARAATLLKVYSALGGNAP